MQQFILRTCQLLFIATMLILSDSPLVQAQTSVDYMVNATVDAQARTIKGSVEIKLKNKSDSAITDIVLRADLNAYQPGTTLDSLYPNEVDRFDDSSKTGYCRIDSIMWHGSPATNIDSLFNSSIIRVHLESPIESGSEEYFYISFESRMPELLADSNSLILAHPFPVLTAWVDNQWRDYPYQGKNEDFTNPSDFSMAISIDTGYTLVHPGELLNEKLHFGILPEIASSELLTDITGVLGESPAVNKVVIPSLTKTYLCKARSLNRPTMVVMKDAVIDRTVSGEFPVSVYYPASASEEWSGKVARIAIGVVDSLQESGQKFRFDELKIVSSTAFGSKYSSNQLILQNEKTGDDSLLRSSLVDLLTRRSVVPQADTIKAEADKSK